MVRRSKVVLTVVLLLLVTSPVGAQTTLQFWEAWGQAALFDGILNEFRAENPDIDIVVTYGGQRAKQREKLLVNLLAGDPPDLVAMVTPLASMALEGLLMPLDDLLAASEVLSEASFAPGVLEGYKVNGQLFGIPAFDVGPWLGMIINVDLMEEAGQIAESPATLDDLVAANRKLTRLDGEGNLIQVGFDALDGMGGPYFPDIWPAMFDVQLYDEATGDLSLDTPGMVRAFEYMANFYERVTYGQVQAFQNQHGWWTGGIRSGKVALHMNGYFLGSQLRPGATDYNYTFGWVPNVKGDRMTVIGGWALVIPKGARNPEAAFKVIEFLTGPTAAQQIYDARNWINGK